MNVTQYFKRIEIREDPIAYGTESFSVSQEACY